MLWEEIAAIPLLATATVSRLLHSSNCLLQTHTRNPYFALTFPLCPLAEESPLYGLSSPETIKEFVPFWYGNIYLYVFTDMYIKIHVCKYCIFKRSHKCSVKWWPSCATLGLFLLCGLHSLWHKVFPVRSWDWGRSVCPLTRMASYFCSLSQLKKPVRTCWSAWQINL